MISLLISFIVLLLAAGIVYWIITQIPGVPPFLPKLVWIVVALIVLLWLVQSFGGSLGVVHSRV